MVIYSYLIDHDLGLAPNPFGKYCTLAVCKPQIRKSNNLSLGDWIIGTGSKSLEKATKNILTNKLVYAMKVSERISLEEYWTDKRFAYKKPIINGPLISMYGDNFYHKNESGEWLQEDSAHSNQDGTANEKHLKTDVGGKNALIAEHFYYFGDESPIIPDSLLSKVCHSGIGMRRVVGQDAIDCVNWIESNFEVGIHGDPISWVKHY